MRRVVVQVWVASVLAAGFGAIGVAVVSHPAPATRGLTCAQPVNPTLREVVNAVCDKFGP